MGQTLTADVSSIADEDGLTSVSYSYQWLAANVEIAGATNSTYTLTADDVEKTIKVRVSFTDDADHEETLTSAATGVVAAKPNTPATGAPTVDGTAQVGETLTALTNGITDADGLTNPTYSYQWLAANVEIAGATNSTYTLVTADQGKTIKVRVSFTDDADHEETLTSAATAAVSAKPNTPATGAPTVDGTAQVGETLRVLTNGITDEDGLTNVSYSHQWLAANVEIAGATNSTYTLSDEDVGKAIKVKVSFTDDADHEETLTSAATGVVAAKPNTPATGAPTVDGTAQVGETLTALTNGITDEDGLTNPTYSYQWIRSDNGTDANIAGQTDSTYTLVAADRGKAIKVKVSFTDDADHQETLTSAATGVVAAKPNTPATGAPTIDGTAQVGETLTALTNGITDADGLTNVSYSYQWIRSDNGTDANIAGQTDSTYTLVAADRGKAIKVKVSFTDDADHEETLTSAATGVVAAKPNTPATGAPTIDGTAQVGETLTVLTNGITDEDGLTNPTYSYQWIRSDNGTDANIAGQTDSTYTLVAADRGKAIKVKVSFTDDADHEETLTSAATGVVAAKPNTPATGAPTIDGTAQVGETLTALTNGITDADGLTNVSYSYQWLADDANIQGATNSTYTLSDEDEGKSIEVRVSFTDAADNAETRTSEATDTVAATKPGVPGHLNVFPHGTGALDVYWEAPASDGGSAITGYKVRWKESADSWETPADVSEATVTGTTHTITGLTDGVEYTVRVMAVNDVGEGTASAEVSGTPQEAAIWSATLTVGTTEKFVGYTTFLPDSNVLGALSPDTITLDDASYTVKALGVLEGKLILSVIPKLAAGFVLVVGTDEFASTDASTLEGDSISIIQFQWNDPGLDWSEGDEVAVSLGAPDDNTPATGTPTISQTAQVGQTLTADVSSIADEDGLTSVSYSYQWLAANVEIAGATNST